MSLWVLLSNFTDSAKYYSIYTKYYSITIAIYQSKATFLIFFQDMEVNFIFHHQEE